MPGKTACALGDMGCVDILMATYNGGEYVRQQIESIQAQSYPHWRLFISDDHSTDDTLEVVSSMAACDERIILLPDRGRFGGARDNFLGMVGYSDGDYFMFCDQDDYWLPRKVELTLSALIEAQGTHGKDHPILSFCDMKVVDGQLNVLSDSYFEYCAVDPSRNAVNQVLIQNTASGCVMLGNAALRDLVRIPADTSGIYMHDWWVMLVAAAFAEVVYVPEPLSLYRQHGDNTIGAMRYSVLSKMLNMPEARASIRRGLAMSRTFGELYADLLDERTHAMFAEYGDLYQLPRRERLGVIARHDLWKSRFAKKVAQVLITLTEPVADDPGRCGGPADLVTGTTRGTAADSSTGIPQEPGA